MKKRIKNNRNKSLLGAILAGSAISGFGSIIQGIISGSATKRAAEQQLRQQTLSGKLQNSITRQNNMDEAANYSNNNNAALEKINELDTLHTAMCFGGKRRMKKAGGTISANVKGLSRYI